MDNSKKDKKQKSKKEVEILDKKKQKLQKKESFREKCRSVCFSIRYNKKNFF